MSDVFSWEYDAPKCVDFQSREHEQDDDAEEYFNYHTEDDNFTHQSEIPEEFSVPLRLATGSINSCSKQPIVKFDEAKHDPQSVAVVKPMQQVQENLTTSENVNNTDAPLASEEINMSGIAPIRPSTSDEPPPSPTETSDVSEKAKPAKAPGSQKKTLANIMTPSRLASWNTGKAKQVGKENVPRKSKNFNEGTGSVPKKPLRRSMRQNKTPQTTHGEPAMKRAKSNNQKAISKHHRANSIDVSKLLKFPTNKSATHKRALTSEEIELQKIEQLRKESEQTKKDNERFLRKSLKQPSVHAPVAKTHCTQPKEFHFKTDERLAKSHSMALRSDASSSKDFSTELRKHNPSPYKPKKTVPRPFHFSDEKKRKLEDCEPHPAPFVPMAKAIIDFHKATPRRFKQPAKSAVAPAGPMKATALHITEPKTPKFTLKLRNKPTSTMSAKEKEDLEVEEMKKYEFKANPVKKAVLEGKEKLKPVPKKSTTKPVEFHLSEGHKDHKSLDNEVKPEPFKAQPVPTTILEKVTGVKEKPAIERTVPKSPAFALKDRAKVRAEKAHEAEVTKKSQLSDTTLSLKSNKSNDETKPHISRSNVYGIPFQPAIKKKGPTEAKPFSFERSDKERFQKKEERIKEIVTEEQKPASFKARPMPVPATPMLPPKDVKEATKAKPFKLQANERASKRVEEWNKQVNEEVKNLRDQTLFKANENYHKVLKGKPFEPKKSHRVIAPGDITLHSDERAKQRELIAMKREAEAKKHEAIMEERKRIEAEEEERRIAELRKELVHKAQGVPKYKSIEIKQSVKQLTTPQSPHFSDRFKK